ncbi:MAG: hypothetical protein H0W15_03915 [Gemmatimonadales bacterium]|nr:hypothetical protein [Gemmatimonadales bacterium]
MRLIAALIFLLTPLQPVAAAALCVLEAQATEEGCDSGMIPGNGPAVAGVLVTAPVLSAAAPDMSTHGCDVSGACRAPAPAITLPPVAALRTGGFHTEAPTDPTSLITAPRPAPPIHPPIN